MQLLCLYYKARRGSGGFYHHFGCLGQMLSIERAKSLYFEFINNWDHKYSLRARVSTSGWEVMGSNSGRIPAVIYCVSCQLHSTLIIRGRSVTSCFRIMWYRQSCGKECTIKTNWSWIVFLKLDLLKKYLDFFTNLTSFVNA